MHGEYTLPVAECLACGHRFAPLLAMFGSCSVSAAHRRGRTEGVAPKAGPKKLGVELHLAIGIISREKIGERARAKTVLLGTDPRRTVVEDGRAAQNVRPGLVVVDGEEALADLVESLWGDVPMQPIQRWLFWLMKNHGPELATSMIKRVMHEQNRRTDNGARWSIPGLCALLMTKLARHYRNTRPGRHGQDNTAGGIAPGLRFRLFS